MIRASGGLARLLSLLDAAAGGGACRLIDSAAAASPLPSLQPLQPLQPEARRGYAQAAAVEQAGGSAAAASAAAALQQSIRSSLDTRRSGVIAVKVGMTQEWDAWGVRVPLSVLWIDDCEVRGVTRAAR